MSVEQYPGGSHADPRGQSGAPLSPDEQGCSLVSFLHDGITVYFGDPAERDGQIRSIRSAVESAARQEGILTHLECEALRPEECRRKAERCTAVISSQQAVLIPPA